MLFMSGLVVVFLLLIRDIGKLAWKYSFRLVPIEIGSMCGPNKMKERLLRFSDFFDNFLKSSCEHGLWSSDDAGICTVVHNERREYSTIRWVAYVAQHQLFDQLPNLLRDVGRLPTTSDINCPNLRRNVWIGTGGTRTPLHFDSSDNFFVQIAGSKYIRLYGTDQTDKLYVIIHAGEGYAKQQNMSAVNCEREDFLKHPKAADAKYMEAILLPGDLIFIPQGVWHYVRALTTSISVNFWF